MEYTEIRQFEQRTIKFTLEHREPDEDVFTPYNLAGIPVTLVSKIGNQEVLYSTEDISPVLTVSAPSEGEISLKPDELFWKYVGMYAFHFIITADGFDIIFPDTEELYFLVKE